MLQHRLVFLLLRRPLQSTLFPYTTLFRSREVEGAGHVPVGGGDADEPGGGEESPGPGLRVGVCAVAGGRGGPAVAQGDRKSTRLNSSHSQISYAVFCLKKKKRTDIGLQSA